MLQFITKNKIIAIAILILVPAFCYFYGKYHYEDGYKMGYNAAYSKGYSDGYADRNKLESDKPQAQAVTETKVVYQKVPYNGTDVQVRTEKPTVTVSVNGKQQKVEQKTETADLAVKTETAVKIKIPERRWKIGIGTDGHKATYMLSAPAPFVKNDAIGVWVAGNREKCMGGVSVSF